MDPHKIPLLAIADHADAEAILSATLTSDLFPTRMPDIFMAYNKFEYQDTKEYKNS